jgi:hypothetical protein
MDAFSKPGANAGVVLNKLPANLNVMYDGLLREHAEHSNVPKDLHEGSGARGHKPLGQYF